MIFCTTEKAADRFGFPNDFGPQGNVVPITISREASSPVNRWAADIFYFERRKCLMLCNYDSFFTLALLDLRKHEIDILGDFLAFSLLELYGDDKAMQKAILEMFRKNPGLLFSRFDASKEQDRRMQAAVEGAIGFLAKDDGGLYRFAEEDTIDPLAIAEFINFESVRINKVKGKEERIRPAERFRELVMAAYGGGKGRK